MMRNGPVLRPSADCLSVSALADRPKYASGGPNENDPSIRT